MSTHDMRPADLSLEKWRRSVATARDLLEQSSIRNDEVARATWLLDRLEDDLRRCPPGR